MNLHRMIFLIGLIWYSINDSIAQQVPQIEINNGLIKAGIYLPDSANGYYRATRFDWSGVIPYLEHDGHSYFGKWFKNYDPEVHESVMGPVEEFSQVGYEEAAIGESFLKIGVGMLVKPEESKYNKFQPYHISDHGTWKIKEKVNEVSIHHHLKNNIWRPECHLVIVGYQAIGTLGRRIVDGAEKIRLWGEYYPVRAKVHTIGGLSAHADQTDLLEWYGAFDNHPPVYLVHGEERSQVPLAKELRARFNAPVSIARHGQIVDIG